MTNSISELKEKWWGVCQTQRIVKEEAIMIIDEAVSITKKELVERLENMIDPGKCIYVDKFPKTPADGLLEGIKQSIRIVKGVGDERTL